MLVRTQLMLDQNLKQDLEIIARRQGKTLSSVARELLRPAATKQIHDATIEVKKQSAREFFDRLGAYTVSGPGDSEYDKYAYDLN